MILLIICMFSIKFSDRCEYILYVLFELNLSFSWKVLILMGFKRILNYLYVIFRHKKRALIGSIKGIYRTQLRIKNEQFRLLFIFLLIWYMNYFEVVKSRHFMWVEQIGSKWLGYGLFIMYSIPLFNSIYGGSANFEI